MGAVMLCGPRSSALPGRETSLAPPWLWHMTDRAGTAVRPPPGPVSLRWGREGRPRPRPLPGSTQRAGPFLCPPSSRSACAPAATLPCPRLGQPSGALTRASSAACLCLDSVLVAEDGAVLFGPPPVNGA